MIIKLPENVYKHIAAGEVINYPASCVKELIENSIDAGADRIYVKIKEGGKKRIRVTDNGAGILYDEVPLAVDRYTTSKIKDTDDLLKIKTFGFRGEALHSIATVSRLTIRTNPGGSETGYEFYFEEGILKEKKPCAHQKGTTVIVEDLFYKFPARRKFLSGKETEERRIIEIFVQMAIANPSVSFILEDEKERIYDLPAKNNLKERIIDIFGNETFENFMELRGDLRNFSYYLFISRKENLSPNPGIRFIFVNQRSVNEPRLNYMLNNIYATKERYPDYILFLFVSPSEIDVNVHPQKSEVKFSGSLKLYYRLKEDVLSKIKEKTLSPLFEFKIKDLKDEIKKFVKEETRQLEFGEISKEEEKVKVDFRNIYQMEKRYIILILKEGIIIIDQHTAHEKVLYEKLKGRKFSSQNLLFPLVFNLDSKSMRTLSKFKEHLEILGFKIGILGRNTISIDRMPSIFKSFKKENFAGILKELEVEKARIDMENVLKTVACKSAVKSGDTLSDEEMLTLVGELFSLEDPLFCPHGRPVIYEMSVDDIDRKFGR